MRQAFVKTLIEIAERDPRVLLLTADLGFMVFEEFARQYPDRFFNVGVAEANMIGLATGLASAGYIPFAYSIATFASMRGYEQIRNGPVLHQLPVRIVGVGGGFEYSHGGYTHYAIEDIGITRIQPGLMVIVPADPAQACVAIRSTYDIRGPIYYRLGKRDDATIPPLEGCFTLGKLDLVREGADILLISMGSISTEVLLASDQLLSTGIRASLAIVSSLRPAPIQDLCELLPRFKIAVTIEEHYIDGGLGSLVAEVAAEHTFGCRIVRCGVTRLPSGISGSESYMREIHGLSSKGIFNTVIAALEKQ